MARYIAIVRYRFTHEGRTLAQVGEAFGISAGRVRQICDNLIPFYVDVRHSMTPETLRGWAVEQGIEDVDGFMKRYGW